MNTARMTHLCNWALCRSSRRAARIGPYPRLRFVECLTKRITTECPARFLFQCLSRSFRTLGCSRGKRSTHTFDLARYAPRRIGASADHYRPSKAASSCSACYLAQPQGYQGSLAPKSEEQFKSPRVRHVVAVQYLQFVQRLQATVCSTQTLSQVVATRTEADG